MRLRLILLFGCLMTQAHAATSPAGVWWTQDRSGVIGITPCGDGFCGRIVGQLNIRDSMGRVPVDGHGVAHCGLTILRGEPTEEPGHFRGTIADPDDGKDWQCEFWVGEDNRLRLRGYLVLPLLGETQIWPPFTGQLAGDCGITP